LSAFSPGVARGSGAGRGSIPSSSLKGAHVMPAREPRTAPGGELKTQPPRELERARAAGAERLTDTLVRLSEWPDKIEVEVRQIADVEDVEHFTNETKVDPFLEPERLCHSNVLRREVVAELVIRWKRDRGIRLGLALHKPPGFTGRR